MPLTVSIYNAPADLKLAAIGMRKASKEMRKTVNDGMRSTFNPIWKQSLAQNLGGFNKATTMMLQGARIKAGNPPELVAASSRRTFGRALKPAQHWYLVEYGVRGGKIVSYTRRSRNGGTHIVKRNVTTMWAKRRARDNGYVATPAAREIIPRITSYWIQSVIKTWADAADKGLEHGK